jgi:hypothetical protein
LWAAEMTMPPTVSDNNSRRIPARSQVAGSRFAAVIAPCSARKAVAAADSARAVSLPQAAQSALETAWQRRLSELPTSLAAGDLYRGRGFRTARRAAVRANCDFFVASAGLGLVRADRAVPAYGLTVTGVEGPDAVRGRIMGDFDLASWWRALQNGPYATAFREVFQGEGLILMALSHAYARLLSDDLSALDEASLTRLRIVGADLGRYLPERVRTAALLPYDDRLDRLVPGVRGDFCQRGLGHFVDLLADERARAPGATDIVAHRSLVEDALGPAKMEPAPRRSRVTDAVIAQRISAHLSTNAPERSVSRLLRAVRDEDGIACEATRFARLYRSVTQTEPEGAAR